MNVMVLILIYIVILIALFIYGNNCLLLAYLYKKRKKENSSYTISRFPAVTVQLPVYNEVYVVERLIRKVAELDYPEDLLEIQVLDDSTDETSTIIDRCIGELREQGVNIHALHRSVREGYKAGALREGMKVAHGEFIAVFDADFLPEPDFLTKCMPHFSDPAVGMVQTRWGHINEDCSLLTKVISIGIDGHFQIEQNSRYKEGLYLNFNGTAGIWRRTCIDDSDGWQDDTLTEDLDLSYRAQLKGWKLVFLDNVISPAEIPVQINAFKRQQFRWAKGSIQCAKKLLPGVIRADIPIFKKMEAVLHLTYYAVHPLMIALLLISLPLIIIADPEVPDFKFFTLGTFGPLTMYALSQKELYKEWKQRLKFLPMLTILGIGISANNSKAVFEAFFNRKGIFQRTPKFGVEKSTDRWEKKKYRLSFPWMTAVEVFLGVYALATLYLTLRTGNYFLTPFLALYALGYFYVSGLTLKHSAYRNWHLSAGKCIIFVLIAGVGLRLYRALMMGDLSEDPFHHWYISAYLASTGTYIDLFSGAVGIWLPGYHLLSSAVLFLLGKEILWLKIMNSLFSLGSIYLTYLIASRYSLFSGLLAASFLALNPLDILTSSTSYAEPVAVFFFLLTVHLLISGKERSAGISLFLGSVTRYEVWLSIPFLIYRRWKSIYFTAPAFMFILAWVIYTYPEGLFLETILDRGKMVLEYEVGSGAVKKDVSLRTLEIVKYFFISAPLVYAAGMFHAIKNIKNDGIHGFALFNLAFVFLITGSGLMIGSYRYFSLIIPLFCIFAAIELSKHRKLAVFVLISILIPLPFYFNLFSDLDVLYQPLVRSGKFTADAGATGVLSNSPVPLYYSDLPADRLFGSTPLKNMNRELGIGYLHEQRIEYIIYVDSPGRELERLFPSISEGKGEGLELVYDPNSWERMYGAKKAYVYRVLPDGIFKRTGSYISSSPILADMDGDGELEVVGIYCMVTMRDDALSIARSFKIESGDDRIMKLMGKNFTPEDAEKAVKMAKEAGIEVGTFFMIGYPGETQETISKTLRFSSRLPSDYLSYTLPRILFQEQAFTRSSKRSSL